MSDKRASEVRRPYRQQECKWFHKIDECHWSKSNIHNQILTSTTLSFKKIIISSTPILCQITLVNTPKIYEHMTIKKLTK